MRPDTGYLLVLGAAVRADGDHGLRVRGHAVGGRARGAGRARAARRPGARPGIVAAALVAVLGNLAGVRTWLHAANPPHDYAWFDPSRVIPNTINEFPSFSFILGDLHAHVLALPFTVLALAFALQVALRGPARRRASGARWPRRSPAGWRSARCTRSTRGRIRSRRACWSRRSIVWLRDRQPRRRGYALVWLCSCCWPASC